jgi:ABC-2 type transport system permease protein
METTHRSRSTSWLFLHEIKVAWRSMNVSPIMQWFGIGLVLVYLGIGTYLGLHLDYRVELSATLSVMIFFSVVAAFTFNVSSAMRSSMKILLEQSDLDLLFSSPISPAQVTISKMLSMTVGLIFWSSLFVVPLLIPIAIINNPHLFGLLVVILAVSILATCLGLGLTLLTVYFFGPRKARSVIQIFAALIGATILITSQLAPKVGSGDKGRIVDLFNWCVAHGIGSSGFTGLAGRAGLSDMIALAQLSGASLLLFILTAWFLQKPFLRVYQSASDTSSQKQTEPTDMRSYFSNKTSFLIMRKEWVLLLRDPTLIYSLVLQLLCLLPLFIGFGKWLHVQSLLPSAAFMSVFAGAKLVGEITGLAIHAEDAPDLLRVSPHPMSWITRWKLYSVLALSVPLTMAIPLAMLWASPPVAALTFSITVLACILSAAIEFKFSTSKTRYKFGHRNHGSIIANILSLAVSVLLAALAGYLVTLIGPAIS